MLPIEITERALQPEKFSRLPLKSGFMSTILYMASKNLSAFKAEQLKCFRALPVISDTLYKTINL